MCHLEDSLVYGTRYDLVFHHCNLLATLLDAVVKLGTLLGALVMVEARAILVSPHRSRKSINIRERLMIEDDRNSVLEKAIIK